MISCDFVIFAETKFLAMDHIELLERISEGAYGEVFKARDKHNGRILAVKRMKAICHKGSEDYDLALREIGLLKKLRHVTVVELVHACITPSGRMYLVFEYLPRTLLSLLKERVEALKHEPRSNPHLKGHRGLPLHQVQSIMYQLCLGIAYMHKQGVMHRDLKPANVLLSSEGVLKICDLGFSRNQRNESKEDFMPYTTYVVTRWYRPPEVVVGESYSISVDIWALGCIWIELLTGTPLFPGKSNNDQLYLIMQGLSTRLPERFMRIIKEDKLFMSFKPPTSAESCTPEQRFEGHRFTPEMWEFFNACLDPEPLCRKTAEELLRLKYFDGVEEHLPEEVKSSVLSAQRKKEAYEAARAVILAASASDHMEGGGGLGPHGRWGTTWKEVDHMEGGGGLGREGRQTQLPPLTLPTSHGKPITSGLSSSRSITQPQLTFSSDQLVLPCELERGVLPCELERGERRRGASFELSRPDVTVNKSMRRRSALDPGEIPSGLYGKAAEATAGAISGSKSRRSSALLPSQGLSRQTSKSDDVLGSTATLSGELADLSQHVDDSEGKAGRSKSFSQSKSRRGSVDNAAHPHDQRLPSIHRNGSTAPVISYVKSLFH